MDNCEISDESRVRENLVTNRMPGKPGPLFRVGTSFQTCAFANGVFAFLRPH